MPECDQILKELDERPKKSNHTNFEKYMVSLFGPTLYKLFIYNYTKKMWDIEPRELAVEWAIKRMELNEYNTDLFNGAWQGVPIGGYTQFLEQIITGIPIEYNSSRFKKSEFDIILFSGKIDELFEYKFGVLPYRSLRFDYCDNDLWENENYGTINLPQHHKYIRKANFKILHQQKFKNSWVQYQEPVQALSNNLPMYPINTKENCTLFDKYLKEACKSDKIIPIGRLGLYKYLDMDKAISLAIKMIQLIKKWKNLGKNSRYVRIKALLKKY
jgi:UDP-galactopyranose mutase